MTFLFAVCLLCHPIGALYQFAFRDGIVFRELLEEFLKRHGGG
jgi:hypothetical protein